MGSLSKSTETRQVARKSTPMSCTGASLSIKEGICFISLAIFSRLGAQDGWGRGGTEATHSIESSLSYARPEEGLLGFG